MAIVQVDHRGWLTDGQRAAVLAMVAIVTNADQVAPLSEQVLLAVRYPTPQAGSGSAASSVHFLASAGARLVGYAHLDQGVGGQGAAAEIVVDPSRRRQGAGTALIDALEQALEPPAQTLGLWSHGDLDGGRAFALHAGYCTVRELWQMRRPLRSEIDSLPAVILPEGFRSRHFVVGRDEEAWLRVNARAFVDHPEQGRLTRDDLDRRIAEPWFDAQGLILIEDTRGPEPMLAASHWTKVVADQDPQVRGATGEVYVVGVDPAYQGIGLGRIVTILGLAYLRQKGLSHAMLYVEADNKAALATYSRLDFDRYGVDIMYERTVYSPV